jgi:hypothetical protein
MKEVRAVTIRADFSNDLSADNSYILQIHGFCLVTLSEHYKKYYPLIDVKLEFGVVKTKVEAGR